MADISLRLAQEMEKQTHRVSFSRDTGNGAGCL